MGISREVRCAPIEDGLLPAMKIGKPGRHVVGRRAIEIAGRLVAEQQSGPPDQGSRNCRALPLTARQRGRPVIRAIGEADLFDERSRPLDLILASRRDERRNQHIFEHRALRQQAVILKDKSNLTVAERRQAGGVELEGIASVERHVLKSAFERRDGSSVSCRCPTAP